MKFSDDYFAGLFDGEGCFAVNRSGISKDGRRRFQAIAALGIRQEFICRALEKRFGGFVRKRLAKNKKHSDHWVWILTGPKLLKFCNDLLPILTVKKASCDIIRKIQLIKIKIGNRSPSKSLHNKQIQLYKQLRILNMKGRSHG